MGEHMSDWDGIIADYVTYMTAIGRPKTTIDLRRYQLAYLAKSLNLAPARITADDLVGWFALHDWKPETRRSYRSGIRGFYRWATQHGHVEVDPAAGIPQVTVPRTAARPAPDIVYGQAVTAADPRTALMLRLAAEVGLRRAEVARVHTRDVRYSPAGAQLLVHGKGSRERVVPITGGLAASITAGAGGHTPGGGDQGWLFPSSRGAHVSPAWVGTLCSQAMPGVWTLHTLRHRFSSRAYRSTRNLRAVQELLGHSNVAITERYTAVDDDEMRAAMMAAVA